MESDPIHSLFEYRGLILLQISNGPENRNTCPGTARPGV